MARQQITVDTITPDSCSASSGPFYDVTYGAGYGGVKVGDWVYVNHEEAGNDGNVLSVYTYQVTAIVDADTLTLKWISSTNSYVDDSPCDLCDGTGSSATCGGIAPNVFKRDLGSAYLMFVD